MLRKKTAHACNAHGSLHCRNHYGATVSTVATPPRASRGRRRPVVSWPSMNSSATWYSRHSSMPPNSPPNAEFRDLACFSIARRPMVLDARQIAFGSAFCNWWSDCQRRPAYTCTMVWKGRRKGPHYVFLSAKDAVLFTVGLLCARSTGVTAVTDSIRFDPCEDSPFIPDSLDVSPSVFPNS